MLVETGKLDLIKGTHGFDVQSHILYPNDIMIFCKGKSSNMEAFLQLFQRYACISRHIVSPKILTLFASSITKHRLRSIFGFLGFTISSLSFSYLGVPIFKGKPKIFHLQWIANKVITKLSTWKASLLSIAKRIQLVKSVIQCMLIYSFIVYSWTVSLIKGIEKWIRNFIWIGDVNNRKPLTVAWHKVCTPTFEGTRN